MSAAQFIGRQAQIEEIEQHLLHVSSGQPRVVLFEGIAGIGKTRFLNRIRWMAAEQGFQISSGCCDETLTQPYAPFADLLPRFETEQTLDDTDMEILSEFFDRSTLALQPDMAAHAESDKFRLMMTVTRAATILALRTPMLIVVDDLHLADRSSLDLFAYLAFFLAEQRTTPLLLLGSYRPVASASHLGHLLSRLRHEPIVREIEVPGLDEAETRAMLRELGLRQPAQQLVRAVWETTHGIPLFVEEVVNQLIRRGALYMRGGALSVHHHALETLNLPPSMSDAIAGRVQTLSPVHQRVFTLAACLGEGFTIDQLEAIGQVGAVVLREAVEAGVTHGVLRNEAGRFRFAHALIRDAFVARLSPEVRQRRHLQIAQALEEVYADTLDTHGLEIAHHLVAAGGWADARTTVHYARRAGDQAFTIYAWEEAVRYYEAAIQAAESIEGFSEKEQAALYYQAGCTHYWNQDAGSAQDRLDQASTIYRTLGDMCGLAHALIVQTQLGFMSALLPYGVLSPYVEPLNRVIDTLGDTEPSLRGHIMAVLAQAYRHARETERAIGVAQRALDLGLEVRDDYLCACAHDSLGLAYLGRLHVEAAISSWQATLLFLERTDDLFLRSQTLIHLPLALNLQGDLEDAETLALEGIDVTLLRQDWAGYSEEFSHLASIAVCKGEFRVVEQHAEETMRMVERSRYPSSGFRALQALACAFALRGQHLEAEQTLQRIIEPGCLVKSPSRFDHVLVRVFRQLILAYRAVPLTEHIASLADELSKVVRYDIDSLAPLCAMIELGQQTFNPQLTEKPATILAAALNRGVLFTSGWCFLIPRVLGIAAVMHEDWGQANDYFQQAIDVASDTEAWPELARTDLDYARMELLIGDFEDPAIVSNPLQEAQRLCHELAMIPHAHIAFHMLEKFYGPPVYDDADREMSREEFPAPSTRNGHTPLQ
ncbi:ATP-binding protein [Candidatus Entotheonella palauensis]|uniref:ATP-binding protein n=1 Tax=Candidatus Entotheonella palauensis TaxID=93172 RepID=UPI000B7E85DD|nr:AAA family ATPase [Candidatus Entotheonella palauensis]